MKAFHLLISLCKQPLIKRILIPVVFIFVISCGNKIEGTFYISEEAQKYMIDTSINSFRMLDNNGVTEEFYLDKYSWYATHHYFSEWGTDGEAFGEAYGVAYHSVLNDFFFMFSLRADVEYTQLEIEWNQKDRFVYAFETGKFSSEVNPLLLFYDSLTVNGVVYKDIIEVDYSKKMNEIDFNTPVKTYISGKQGLVKFQRKDSIIFERIPGLN
jgi:hypothetical protein